MPRITRPEIGECVATKIASFPSSASGRRICLALASSQHTKRSNISDSSSEIDVTEELEFMQAIGEKCDPLLGISFHYELEGLLIVQAAQRGAREPRQLSFGRAYPLRRARLFEEWSTVEVRQSAGEGRDKFVSLDPRPARSD